MSAKLIIYITGKPTLHGHKRREFLWSPAHSCYLYEGREIEPAAFNAKFEKAVRNNADLNPRVKMIEYEDAESVPPISRNAASPRPEPELSIDEQLERAEAVINRFAPERLKKKTGPKPVASAAIEV
jgi:hypothetical protein